MKKITFVNVRNINILYILYTTANMNACTQYTVYKNQHSPFHLPEQTNKHCKKTMLKPTLLAKVKKLK